MELKPLSEAHVVVTGGSRDIGGGIVLELAKAGAHVISVFRSKPDRAAKIVEEVKKSPTGKEPILVQADLVTQEGKDKVFASWKEKFENKVDVLVLCASGATMEINVDANMALVDKFLDLRREQLEKGEKLSTGTIIFLQSEPGHYQRVIDGVFDFIAYYKEKVGPAKRAGEDALRDRFKKMDEVGVRGIVVCPPEVTDTFNMKLFELQNKEARDKSRELSAKLGTRPYVSIAEVARRVGEIVRDASILNRHLELFGNVKDGLAVLSAIYGEEAIYVHTFEKVAEGRGIGRMIVNPMLWKRNDEPSFAGHSFAPDGATAGKSELHVTKDHMRGHFRPDIASLLPGHKSIRTASVALGRFLNEDRSVDEQKIYLKKYSSVKFRSPVLPDQVLETKVTLDEKSEETVTGHAVQAVNGKESMDIRGMQVVKLKENEKMSVLLLDQLVEAAAQCVGMYALESITEDLLPLFHSTGEAELHKSIAAGDNLLIKTENAKIVKMGSMNIFSADFEISRGFVEMTAEDGEQLPKVTREETVATIKNLQGLLLPKEEVLKKLR